MAGKARALSKQLTSLPLLMWQYVLTTRGSKEYRSWFDQVHTFVLFLGYSRSGHSIVSALLDAHPNAVVASEVGALKYVYAGFDRDRLLYLLCLAAARSARVKRRAGGHTYEVPGLWQGRFEQIHVIGDKQAEGVTLRLRARPWLHGKMAKTVGIKVRYIHVFRNPFDNISSMARHEGGHGGARLRANIDEYFRLCESVMEIKKLVGDASVIDIQLETLIGRSNDTLSLLCRFLGLVPSDNYLEKCKRVIYKAPRRSRNDCVWSDSDYQAVIQRMKAFPHLRCYGFHDVT